MINLRIKLICRSCVGRKEPPNNILNFGISYGNMEIIHMPDQVEEDNNIRCERCNRVLAQYIDQDEPE